MGGMKAIETVYKGYRFRSRLEARWAVFFDTLDIKWEYEKEGFDIDGVWYLPDFWLPEQGCWIEIKPDTGLTEDEAVKLSAFGHKTEHPLYVCKGLPGQYEAIRLFQGRGSNGYWWCECPVCGKVELYQRDIVGPRSSALMHLDCLQEGIRSTPPMVEADFAERDVTPRMMAGYDAARQARFEHGEQP